MWHTQPRGRLPVRRLFNGTATERNGKTSIYPILGGNICVGSWKTLDQSHVYRNHYGWLYNNGLLAGWFNETETDKMSWDGNSYTGTNETTLYFFGMPPQVSTGTATATRLAP